MEANIIVVSKRATKQQQALIDKGYLKIDLTSTSTQKTFQKFSPFFSHLEEGGFKVPGMDGVIAASVEGVWQGLKVFEKEGVDASKFKVVNMKNIKRSSGEKRGRVTGHALGSNTVGYLEARKRIYVPLYTEKLQKYLKPEIELLTGLLQEGNKLMLLDYETNGDINDLSKPLSHATLVAQKLQYI